MGTAVLATALVGLVSAPVAAAQPPTSPASSTPFTTPNTDSCPNKTAPPKAIDLSEVPAPGEPAPTPLPVSDHPIGGDDLGACGVVTPDGSPALPPDISATAWQVSDLDTGKVLAAKDPHGRYRPASTIKVLLAIVALRELDLDTVVVGTTEDADVDGTLVGIGPGGHYTNRQLMQALVMASGNDAAHALAAQLGGNEATVAKMNAVAAELGARDTRAATPSGLDGPGMSTSAYDLSLVFRAAMTIPTFAELIHTEQVEFPGFPADPRIPDDSADEPRDHPPFPIGNDNQLLYDYDGALGGKTGYTDDARQTFVAGAERDGRRLAVTLLAADVLPIRPWEQAARLLDYGFALDKDQSIGVLVSPAPTTGEVPRSPGWTDRAPLAAPPPDTRARDVPAGDDTDHELMRIAVVLGGSVVVLLLVIAAAASSRRRR
ncbi:MAG TPA: serine hydrolase [Aldersonia sp.]